MLRELSIETPRRWSEFVVAFARLVIQMGGSFILELWPVNPLSPSIKLQILLLCFHTFQTQWGEAVKISLDFNLSDHVRNSHDLTN